MSHGRGAGVKEFHTASRIGIDSICIVNGDCTVTARLSVLNKIRNIGKEPVL